MLARHSPNAKRKHHAAGSRHSGQGEEQVIGVVERCCSPGLDLE